MNTQRMEVKPKEIRPGDVLVRAAGSFPVLEVPERDGRWVRVVTERRAHRLAPRSRFEVYREVSR